MCFGMFMAFLDIQIVSASLAEIQAGLAASRDEISWVQTAYLIAEVVAIPLSGFLSRALGTRIMFAGSAAGFTIASLMCGFTSSMNEMIFWRAVQGFIGGGMVPTVFASTYTIFPRSKQAMIVPMIGLVATLAPDHRSDRRRLSHRRAVMALAVLHQYRPRHRRSPPPPSRSSISTTRTGRCSGSSTGGGSASWRRSWARSNMCWRRARATTGSTTAPSRSLAVVCVLSAAAFFARVLTASAPIVDLKAYANRNFALGSMFSFVLGIGLYGLTYLFPVYLEEIRGYNALMVGETMFVSGAAMFLSAPVVGKLVTKVDPRLVLTIGFFIFAAGSWQMTYVTKDWDFAQLLWPQIFRGVGMMLAIVPITNLALGTLAPERLKNASGLFNLARNLGGAVGLAALNTVLNHRIDLHLARLHEAVGWGRQPAQEMLTNLTARFQDFGSDAQTMALRQLMGLTRQQGTVMAFADVFLMLAVLFVLFGALAVVMRRPAAAPGWLAGH